MSGITGIFQTGGDSVLPNDVGQMVHILSHRGADAAAVWTEGGVGLGYCAWRTASNGREGAAPLVDPEGPFVLVADASIDNRHEIAARLGWDRPNEATDHAVIMGAYLRWGERCAEHLLGDFAFAIWDGQRQHLFCARDHLGLRPFYYCRTGRSFAFASEIKALLQLPRVPHRPNEERVADFLLQTARDQEATFYEGILRLPPAHSITVTPEGMRMQRYWSLDPNREIRLSSDDAYAEAYRERFMEAVRCCVGTSAPVGCLLSGGLDSSSITAAARLITGATDEKPLHTFSCVFDDVPSCDERRYMQAVVRQGGLKAHYVHADRTSIFADLDRILHYVDEPFFTPNLFLSWQAWRAAGDAGVGCLLHGFLGDNVTSDGSRYLTELALAFRWPAFVREMRAAAGLRGHPLRLYRHMLRRFVMAPLIPSRLRRGDGIFVRKQISSYSFYPFVCADFSRRVGWTERARAYAEQSLATPRTARGEHHAELTSGMLPGALEIENKASAVFGFRQRYPFADRRLVEFCLAVPPEQKYRNGWTRFLLRNAMRGVLPEEVRTRITKANLHPGFRHALMTLGRPELDAIMYDRLPIVSEYLDVSALQAAYRKATHHKASRDHPGQSILPFWLAALLVRWRELERDRLAPQQYDNRLTNVHHLNPNIKRHNHAAPTQDYN